MDPLKARSTIRAIAAPLIFTFKKSEIRLSPPNPAAVFFGSWPRGDTNVRRGRGGWWQELPVAL